MSHSFITRIGIAAALGAGIFWQVRPTPRIPLLRSLPDKFAMGLPFVQVCRPCPWPSTTI